MDDPINPRATEKKCKGLIFRAHVNGFVNMRGQYIYKESMTLLKRQSCPGCEDGPCDRYLWDDLLEDVSGGTFPIIKDIVNDALYKLIIVNKSIDWETGTVDEYDLEFRKIDK